MGDAKMTGNKGPGMKADARSGGRAAVAVDY